MKIKLNPDKKHVDEIKKKLKENEGYCPCSLVKNEDTRCRCKEFREQINRHEAGMCHCGLWIVEL